MKAQSSIEYLLNYGWALILIVFLMALLVQLGVLDINNYVQPSARVVGFNSFNINRYMLQADGDLTLYPSNLLAATVTITQISVDGSQASGLSPTLPLNLSAGSNVTINMSTAATGTIGSIYEVRLMITFDVERGTAGHFDSGTLKGEYQLN